MGEKPENDPLISFGETLLEMIPKGENLKNSVLLILVWAMTLYVAWITAQHTQEKDMRQSMETIVKVAIQTEDIKTQIEIQELSRRMSSLEQEFREWTYQHRNQPGALENPLFLPQDRGGYIENIAD